MGRRLRWIALLATTALSLAGGGLVQKTPDEAAAATAAHGLSARYFDREGLSELKLRRIDPAVNFEWGRGSPSRALKSDTFSARWQGEVKAPASGVYRFSTRTSDGVRLWIDGRLIVDRWRPQSVREWSGRARLQAGRRHSVRMEFFERTGAATAELLWSGPGISKQVVPSSRLFPRSSPPSPPAPQCSDGRDNDGDGRTDHPSDHGCGSTTDTTESPDPPPPAPAPTPHGAERWSDPATWGAAGLPKAGDTVTIPAGKTVLLDRSTPPLSGLEVHGTLIFDDDYLTLTSDWVMVHGKLRIGAADKPFSKRARIESPAPTRARTSWAWVPRCSA